MIRRLFLLILGSILSYSLYANDVIVNASPSPARPGDSVRVSIITKAPYSVGTIRLPNGAIEKLLHVNENLHKVTIQIPDSVTNPSYRLEIELQSDSSSTLELPYSISISQENTQALLSLEGQGELRPERNKTLELEQEIESLETRIDDLQLDKLDLNNQLEDLLEELQKLKDDTSKADELAKKQEELEKLSAELELKDKEISEALSQLRKQSVELNKKQEALQEKENELIQREETLEMLEQEIDKKSSELNTLKVSLSSRETKLSETESKLKQERAIVLTKRNELDRLTDEADESREKLVRLTLEMEETQREYEKEQQQLVSEQKAETESLRRKRENLETLQGAFEKTQLVLAETESEKKKLNENLRIELQNLEVERESYRIEKQSVESERKQVQQLEQELDVRVGVLNSLDSWLSIQLSDLQKNYVDKNKKNDEYLATFDTKFDKLESLSRLMEDRAKELDKMNADLKKKNVVLRSKLQGTYGYTALLGVSPYLGLKHYSDEDIATAKLAGFRTFTALSSRFALQGGLVYQSANITDQDFTQTESKFIPELHLNYTFTPAEKYDFYSLLGLGTDFLSSDPTLMVFTGFGYRLPLDSGDFLRMETHISNGIEFNFGIEKILKFRDAQEVESLSYVEPQTQDYVEMAVTAPPKRRHVILADVNLDFLINHWAYPDFYRVASYSLLDIDEKTFQPNGTIDKFDAMKMIVSAYHIREFLKEDKTPIDVSIIGGRQSVLSLDILVSDTNGKIIRRISRKNVTPGDFTFFWDGRDQNGVLVDDGDYVIDVNLQRPKLDLTSVDDVNVVFEIVRSEQRTIQVYSQKKPEITPKLTNIDFSDLSSSEELYAREALYLNLISLNKVDGENMFYPEKVMKRDEFIIAISKVLHLLGVEKRDVRIDLSTYADTDLIDDGVKPFLQTYILELGYGGDEKSRLRLTDNITQAEASVIIARLLHWIVNQD